jgi:uncharacterized membrane protein YeaQ/YmgE (transglycosylase-associated protein family)
MEFVAGFIVWIAIAIAGGFVFWTFYRGPETDRTMTYVFALLGAAVGGMLGASPYIWHDPNPLRFGAVLGAMLGAALFPWVYHFAAKRAL